MSSAYLDVFRHSPVRLPFAASLLGRLPIAMTPIALVLTVSHHYGSYTAGGVASGVFGLGTAVGGPLLGRVLDRKGQPRVIGIIALVCAAILMGIVFAQANSAPLAVVIVFAFGAGASFPPFAPAMRACWQHVFDDERRRRAGYAIDASSMSGLFIAGPLVVSVAVASGPAPLALLTTAALLAVAHPVLLIATTVLLASAVLQTVTSK